MGQILADGPADNFIPGLFARKVSTTPADDGDDLEFPVDPSCPNPPKGTHVAINPREEGVAGIRSFSSGG